MKNTNTNTVVASNTTTNNTTPVAPTPAPVKIDVAEYRKNKKVADNFQSMLAALGKGDYKRAGEAAINGGIFAGLAEREAVRAQSWAIAKAVNEASDADKTNEELAFAAGVARGDADIAEKAAKDNAAKTGAHCAFIERYAKLLANCTSEEGRAKIKAEMAAELKKRND